MAYSIDQELHQYIDKLNFAQKRSVLHLIKSFLETGEPIDVEQYNQEIDGAMIRMDAGKYISQEDLEKEV